MNCSLIKHPQGYEISSCNVLFSVSTGFSGAPYAIRHYQNAYGSRWGHRIICVLEFLPVIGFLVALIERIVVYLSKRKTSFSLEEDIKKMLKNTNKAITEHAKKDSAYTKTKETFSNLFEKKETETLDLSFSSAEAQGPRPTMEDAFVISFPQNNNNPSLVAIFDGHGGEKVSKFASKKFSKNFLSILKKSNENVYEAFELFCQKTQQKIAKNSSWNQCGSTAVMSYIDPKTHLIYTATLGDSEANIYRNGKSLPLSCVRDWSHPKEAMRVAIAHNKPAIATEWPKTPEKAKYRRSHINYGVNVSRAFGDIDQSVINGCPVVSHKPKITVSKLEKGDVVIWACDGLKDFATEGEIAKIINKPSHLFQKVFSNSLAKQLVDFAVNEKESQDNVSVIAAKIA